MYRTAAFVCCLFIVYPELGNGQDDNKPTRHSINDLEWLTGSWTGSSDGMETEEHWVKPKGGMMLAVNRTARGDKGFFEFLRIQQKGDSISYFASPGGRPATEFKLKERSERRVVFENLENDFPQRIIYQRKKESLHVKIEGEDQGRIRSTSWTWDRKK